MAEIAAALSMSRATLYRYFPSRDALVRELALDAIRVTDEAAARVDKSVETYREAFESLLAESLPYGDRYHFLMSEPRVMQDPEVRAAVERQNQELVAMIDEAKQWGELDSAVPTAWIAAAFDALMWAAWSSVYDGTVAAADAPRLAMQTFWQGICTE